MPELPDLYVFSENLKKRILNKKISEVSIGNPYKVDRPETFCAILTGNEILDIVRDGKELRFFLSNDNTFNVHLMLNGKFFISCKDEAAKLNSKIVTIFFEDEDALALTDYQGLCRVTLNEKVSKSPDALSDAFTLNYFLDVIKRNALKNIKALLIDQSIVRGIGNAYVDEILWKADISPESVSGKIPEEKIAALYEAIPFVLNDAIENIKKISPEIINGEERSFLRVHNPRKQFAEDGCRIMVKNVASKKTYYTEKQKLYK